MYSTYLFDWDGTLADTLGIWLRKYHEIFNYFQIPITDEEIGQRVFGDWGFAEKFGISDPDKYIDHKLAEVLPELRRVELMPGAKETLDLLKAGGAKLAIVSTTGRNNLVAALEHNQMMDYFDTLVCGEDVEKHKPDPEPLNLALARLGVSHEDAVMVGDSEVDMLAGKAARVDTVLFYRADYHGVFYDYAKLLATKPDRIIDNLAVLGS